ncbi:MAG: hypothetical protein H0S79_09085 [Anaerolineaceae bacterium]|nr:hypothetical protein [Anaerolineaceae bacterium]
MKWESVEETENNKLREFINPMRKKSRFVTLIIILVSLLLIIVVESHVHLFSCLVYAFVNFFKSTCIRNLINWFSTFEIKPDFLSDVAEFEAAIIAFLIPLSIEIVSKLSERYDSDVIIDNFENSFSNKILPFMLILNIILAITLRFFANDFSIETTEWKIFAWVIFISFIFIAIMILIVIKRTKNFMTSPTFSLNQLYKKLEEALEK